MAEKPENKKNSPFPEENSEEEAPAKTLPAWYFMWTRIFRISLFFFLILFFFQPFMTNTTFTTLFSAEGFAPWPFSFALLHILFSLGFLVISFLEYYQKSYLSVLTLPASGLALIFYAPFVPQGTITGILYFIIYAFSFLFCLFECLYFRKGLKEKILWIGLSLLLIALIGLSMYFGFYAITYYAA